MSAKSLIRKLKDIFGLSEPDREARRSTDGDSVTVEREPDTSSEDAVKGTDSGGTDSDLSADDETDADETDADETDADEEGEPVEGIKGIGPTYRDRLVENGIETVADLAATDAETVADAAETTEGRAADWVKRAENR